MQNLQGGTLALEHRYDVVKREGRHGFITLYHGLQDPFSKPVWVKAYDGLADAGASGELFDRLKEAGRQASTVDAPGVLRIVDYGELAGGIPFVISERSGGSPLSDVLIREGTLSAEATAALVRRLADVLSAAHQQGVAHGSLSPRWIYVEEGRFSEAMVDHFQLAVTVTEILDADSAVMSAEAVSAFPPEMFEREDSKEGSSPFHPNADVWSLGVLAYMALVGVHPFFEDELDASEGILKLRNDQARPLSELGVDSQISEVVERALAKEPTNRWKSVAAFADAFEAAAFGPSFTKGPAEEKPKEAASSENRPSELEPDLATHQRAAQTLDGADERQPGPSDLLLTSVIVLLFVTNLAWLFYATGSDVTDAAESSVENKPSSSAVMIGNE